MTPTEQALKDAAIKFPVGRAVRFFPIANVAEFETSKIRSAPWALGHGAMVIAIDGRAGGVLIDHLEVI